MNTLEQMKIKRPIDDRWPISSPYGDRTDPLDKSNKQHHNGIDFACPEGTEVRAVCDGKIERVGFEDDFDPKKGFGLRIWQTFESNGIKYGVVYAHLSKVLVDDFMKIKEGEVIGLSGNTGRSTGNHLHIGVREWNTSNWSPIEV